MPQSKATVTNFTGISSSVQSSNKLSAAQRQGSAARAIEKRKRRGRRSSAILKIIQPRQRLRSSPGPPRFRGGSAEARPDKRRDRRSRRLAILNDTRG